MARKFNMADRFVDTDDCSWALSELQREASNIVHSSFIIFFTPVADDYLYEIYSHELIKRVERSTTKIILHVHWNDFAKHILRPWLG